MPRPIYTYTDEQLSSKLTEHYDKHADRYWEEFYVRNDDRFFSDRHYLQHEFPELAKGPITVFEAGCGVGNTVFPVLEANPEAVAYACDFSPHAVSLVQQHALHAAGRVHAFVADLTKANMTDSVPAGAVDFCCLIFVLSAVDPSKMPQVLYSIAGTLKKGSGEVLFRDYVEGDLAESRLAGSNRQQKLQENFYVRGDGTRAFFFSKESLLRLFSEAGYTCKAVHIHERTIENRRKSLLMDRRWIQAVFVYTGRALPASSAAETISARPLGHGSQSQQSSRQLNANDEADESSNGVVTRIPEALAAEWEACLAEQSADTPISHLFEDEQELQEAQQHISIPGMPALSVHSVNRSHRHTLTHTGLMLWESAPALAAYLLANPYLLSNKQIMEVGAGGNPAVAFAALRHCRRVVSTEGSPQALRLFERNVCANARAGSLLQCAPAAGDLKEGTAEASKLTRSLAVIERLRVRRLAWGDAGHQASLQQEFGHFDLVLGSDVVYVDEVVPLLMASLAALLRRGAQSRVILCHITRGVSEGRIIELAHAAGLSLDAEGQLDGAVRMLSFKWQGVLK